MHSRSPSLAVGLIGLCVVTLVACTPSGVGGSKAPEAPAYAAPAAPPRGAAVPAGIGVQSLVDPLWLADTANSTGIPDRALVAYAGVAIAKAKSLPSCGLSWNTLAGIGWVESKHGSFGGSEIGADGTVSPPIYGVELSGGGTANIPDSDKGAIDGDAKYDRAVGPMQLIPQTWRNWHTDASGDGKEDPQNVEDAVMATANYLCRASKDMADPVGWRAGIAAYNSDPAYAHLVADAANSYSQ